METVEKEVSRTSQKRKVGNIVRAIMPWIVGLFFVFLLAMAVIRKFGG